MPCAHSPVAPQMRLFSLLAALRAISLSCSTLSGLVPTLARKPARNTHDAHDPGLAISRTVAVVWRPSRGLRLQYGCQGGAGTGRGGRVYNPRANPRRSVGAGGALSGTTRLEYDHKFRFEQDDTRVDITIKGEIPLHGYQATLRRLFECKDEFVDWGFLRMYGEGTVNLDGSYDWTSEPQAVHMFAC